MPPASSILVLSSSPLPWCLSLAALGASSTIALAPEAQTGRFANDLDDLDLLVAGGFEHDELGLLGATVVTTATSRVAIITAPPAANSVVGFLHVVSQIDRFLEGQAGDVIAHLADLFIECLGCFLGHGVFTFLNAVA